LVPISQVNKGDETSWFHDPSWQAGEFEADEDIATGRVTTYKSSDELLVGFARLMTRHIELAVGLALIVRVLWLAFRHDGGALDVTWSARG